MENPYSPEAIRRARKRELRTWLLILLAVVLIVGGLLLRNAWAGTRRAQIGEVSRWDKSEPFPSVTFTLEKATISRWQLLGRTVGLTLHNDTGRTLRRWPAYEVDRGTDPMDNYDRLEYRVNGVWRCVRTNLPENTGIGGFGDEKDGFPLSVDETLSYSIDFNFNWGNIYEPGEYRLVMFVSEDSAPASEAQPVFATFTIK
ncbi:MAG: hypothetical protein VB086_12345 [Clostridiaceae bacterium]|nr:hypothetical protein [Clostridiaceae bacterium]